MALRNCCCCAPLRTGTLVIAILYLVVNVLGILGFAAYVVIDACFPPKYISEEHHKDVIMVHVYMLLGVILLSSLCIAANSCLIVGIRRNQRKFMLPWIVWYAIFNITWQLLWMVGCGYWIDGMVRWSHSENSGLYTAVFITTFVPGVILFTVTWYWYACVVSYYLLLAPSDSYVMETLGES